MDKKLISVSDIRDSELISRASVKPEEVYPYVSAAQRIYMLPVLGKELLDDFFANPTNADNLTVIPTAKLALVYYSYSLYVLDKNVVDTQFGMGTRKNDFFEPVSEKTLARKSSNAHTIAKSYEEELIDLLVAGQKEGKFLLWKGCKRSKSGSDIILTPVSKCQR